MVNNDNTAYCELLLLKNYAFKYVYHIIWLSSKDVYSIIRNDSWFSRFK